MKMVFRTLCAVSLLAGLTGIASAAEFKGFLMDKSCSAKAVSQKAAMEHDRECALADACQRSGYGIYTPDGKWLNLDAAGNTKAIAALKGSKKAADLKVTVTGDIAGDTIKVASLKMD